MKLPFLFCITFFCTTAALIRGPAGRIIGGENVRSGQYRFAVAINVQTSNSRFFCTGALGNSRWIITSGTCVNGALIFTIHVGSIILNDPDAIIVATDDYLLHPDFNENALTADIGLINLHVALKYSETIGIVITYWQPLDLNHAVTALGWGQVGDNATMSNNLQFVDLTVISNDLCRAYYGNQITDDMVCAHGTEHEGICTGDTGGPLFFWDDNAHTFWLVGVASFLSAFGCEGVEPSGYARILPFLDWIDSFVYSNAEPRVAWK